MSDKIEEIRERYAGYSLENFGNAHLANQDRGWLLAEVDRQRAEIEQLRAGIQSLAESLRASLDAAIRQRDEARAEIERLREEIKRLRKVYVLIATESAGIVEGGSIFEDKIAGCYASHQSADKSGENLGYVNWRIEEHTIISNALEGKP